MRDIPDGLLGGKLRRFDPMCHKAYTRRDSHTLKISVKNPQRTDQIYKTESGLSFRVKKCQHAVQLRAEADDEIDRTREQKSQRHDLSLAETVHQHSVDETRESVDDAVKGEEYTQLGLGDSEFRLHGRDGHSEILPYKIKKRIADEKYGNRAPFPVTILPDSVVHYAFIDFRLVADVV